MELARIGGSAHGVVTRAELLEAGLTVDEIRQRVRVGSLLAEYPGIYRVGHRAASVEARYLAAVRACGVGALLSGRAAAYLLGLLRGSPPPPEVTAPTQRRVRGVTTHRARRVAVDGTTWCGVPVTTVAWTLVDLAGVLDLDGLARACHEAGVRFHTTPRDVDAVLARRSRCAGAAKLRRILHGDVRVTLSALEKRFLAWLVRSGPAAPGNQSPRWRAARGLPLARAAVDRRARQLPLPSLTSLMGAGPAPRARSPCPRG